MSLQNPVPGANATAEYLVSGIPFLTSSAIGISGTFSIAFPFVTRTITVRNTGAASVQIGVTQNGVVKSNYYTIPSGASEEFQFRTTQFFVYTPGAASSVSIAAGLTMIPSSQFPTLTGSLPLSMPGVG